MNVPAVFPTDQRTCYNSDGDAIPCPGTGQDGEYRHGRPWPNPRFGVDGGTVLDKLTGLYWSRNASPSHFPFSWPEAHAFVEKLNDDHFTHRSDWRLPERRELFSLVSHARANPALPENHPFTDVFHGYYWTATACSRLPNQAWYVHMGGGRVFKGMQHGAYMVWPVSGTSKDNIGMTSRFEIFKDDAVIDRLTGLIWIRRADLAGSTVSWQGALAAVKRLNTAAALGFSDWRLPNIRELESLVDPLYHSPALFVDHSFQRLRDAYWSATTSVYEPSYAWVLYTVDGAVGVGYKSKPEFYVWAVRSTASEGRTGA